MQDVDDVVAEPNGIARLVEAIDGRRRLDAEAEHQALLDRAVVEEQIVAVEPDGDAERGLGAAPRR